MPTSPEDRPRIRRTRSGPKEGTAPLSQGAVSPPGKMEDRVFREKSGNLFSMSDFITPAPDVEYQMVSSDYKYRGLTESLLNLDGDEDPSSGVSASEWRQFLSSEQERVMARLKQEQAVMDKVVRLQQQRLHHEKEEAQILLLQNVAERDLELEQIRERSESKVRMEEREQRDSMLQAFEMKLQEHVQRKRVEDAKFEQLQAAHTLALQQALKLQRNRDAFNKRLEQKEERHTREGQELVQWQERTISNAEMSVNMRLKSIPTEAKAILIKAHALEIEHMRVTHAKQGDQLRERQLVNQKQTAKSFEYEQKCVHDAMKLEAGHLAAVQKLQAEHELELMKLKHSLDSDMQQYTRTRRAAGFEMDAETVTRKQKRTAKKLRARFQKEIEVKRRAWNNQLEDDFVDFMSEFDPSVSTDPASTTTPSVSADGDMGRHPPEHGNGTEGYGEDSNSGSGTEEERKQRKELADKIEEEEGAKQTNSMMRIKMVVDSHKRVLSALRKEHADAMDALRRESIAGAKRLRDRMESELKGMRQSQAEDMARLLKLQEKSVEATQRAVTAELKTVKALERERGNLLEFLGFVCHELRNPLCAITGLTEMVLASQGSTNPVDCTGTILTQCVIMKRIVDDVLDLSKIEEGKVDLKVEPIDLPELLDSTVSAYRLYAKDLLSKEALPGMTRRTRESLIITSKLEDSVAAVLWGDNVRVRQILGNLTSNAIKFTYKGSVTITVTQPTKGQIMFSVKDTGLGISETDQRKLFGKYEQLATFRPSTAGTTGLGLCISKSLVKRMGGKMGVDSKPKQGSTFWFTLPVIDPPVKAKRRSVVGRNDSPRGDGGIPQLLMPEMPREITSGPPHVEIHREPAPKPEDLVLTSDDLRVLVAEDNPVLQMTLKAMLMRLGITPVVVGNGADVVKECGGDPFDLLILDIQMPEMNGDTALAAVLQKEHPLKAVACTGDAMPHQIEHYKKVGFSAVVTKPFTFAELTSALLEMGILSKKEDAVETPADPVTQTLQKMLSI